ncbi:ABC transporter ATP-binding protein [Propioniciclava tarda]|nr:ATP-binding cassette domain-containing protein [Propioniciclava tarda]SMO49666.1 ABC-2 type transport system ATP-binding protein [Propioniciclava tarda]HOA88768.1 ATP-binding cassette domain-containing protein [Propioniciclava tarda]HQA31108.1 ATP-binding cassette domain-containing protein [Propioniciclava tarda]HQD60442.1 ATP-binding cassette domain-containing protein [Propioniciclava tarda]
MQPTPVIEVDDFTMTFGDKTVIDGLTFDVRPGETFGLLGSNGSGKTTTIRALLGIYTPTAGRLLVQGRPYDPAVHGGLSYLPEERGLYKKETVIDVMTYFGQLKGLPRAQASAWSLHFLERVDLASHARTRLDKLSGGQQQKVQLGVTVMANPEILILDEPTKGFDPVNRRLLLDIIEDHQRAGATVVMVTHQMEEVERLCDRVLLLKDGRAEAYGTVTEVQEHYGGRMIRLTYAGVLPTSSAYVIETNEKNYAELSLTSDADAQVVLRQLLDAGVTVRSFEAGLASMEEVFLRIYGADAAKEA